MFTQKVSAEELFSPHPTALIFRLLYVVIAVAFGVFLWRANWRERELRALEQSVLAFQRQLDAPALRILAAVRASAKSQFDPLGRNGGKTRGGNQFRCRI